MLIGQQLRRKYRRGDQNRRFLERGKAESAVITQTQFAMCLKNICRLGRKSKKDKALRGRERERES